MRLRHPVESNGVFAALNPALIEPLQRDWNFTSGTPATHVVRWMAAFDTTEDDVDAFVAGDPRRRGRAHRLADRGPSPTGHPACVSP